MTRHYFVREYALHGPHGEQVSLLSRWLTGKLVAAHVQDTPQDEVQCLTYAQLGFYMRSKGVKWPLGGTDEEET